MARTKLWLKYQVVIRFRDYLLGGIPLDPEMIERWINSSPNLRELMEAERRRIAEEHKAETAGAELAQELKDQLLTGFHRDQTAEARGLYIEARYIRGCFREAATTSGLMIELRGSGKQVGLKQTLQHGSAVKPVPDNPKGALFLGRQQPDAILRSVAHVSGPQGQRSCFKLAEAVFRPTLTFQYWFMDNGCMDTDLFAKLLAYVGEVGLGKDRSQDRGRFDVIGDFADVSDQPSSTFVEEGPDSIPSPLP